MSGSHLSFSIARAIATAFTGPAPCPVCACDCRRATDAFERDGVTYCRYACALKAFRAEQATRDKDGSKVGARSHARSHGGRR